MCKVAGSSKITDSRYFQVLHFTTGKNCKKSPCDRNFVVKLINHKVYYQIGMLA